MTARPTVTIIHPSRQPDEVKAATMARAEVLSAADGGGRPSSAASAEAMRAMMAAAGGRRPGSGLSDGAASVTASRRLPSSQAASALGSEDEGEEPDKVCGGQDGC